MSRENLLGHSAGKICSSVGVVPADILSQNISQELTSDAKDLGNSLRSPKSFRCDGHLPGSCKVEAGDEDPAHRPQAESQGDHGVTKPEQPLVSLTDSKRKS